MNKKYFPAFAILCLCLCPFSRAEELLGGGFTPPLKADRESFESCRRDAQKGDAKSQGLLGLMYEEGSGTEKDYVQALDWLQKGARKGDADAQNNLGVLYFKGLGIKKDDHEALKWFQKAAAQGLASAQGNLALMYGRGSGVEKDYVKAMDWFKKAAMQDDADSQVNLGILYSLGEGAPRNFVESYVWFTLALKHYGLQDSQVTELRDNIEWLEKRMKGKEVAEAKKRVAEWKSVLGTDQKP